MTASGGNSLASPGESATITVVTPAQIIKELTGGEQRWLALCKEAMRGSAAALSAVQSNGTLLTALDSGRTWAPSGDPLSGLRPFDRDAAECLRDLALGLAGTESIDRVVSLFAQRAARAGLVSVGQPGARLQELDLSPRLNKLSVLLVSRGLDPTTGTILLAGMELLGERPRTVARVSVPVLLGGSAREESSEKSSLAGSSQGAGALLTLELLSAGPVGLHSDPALMGFFRCDNDFVEALSNAWKCLEPRLGQACVLWSLRRRDDLADPWNEIEGGSLGGALAVALDDLTFRSRRFRRLILDPDCAVSAEIDQQGVLGPVRGYAKKIPAAERWSLRVVVSSNSLEEARTFIPNDSDTDVIGAVTLSEAIDATRTKSNPVFRRNMRIALIIFVVVSLAIGAIVKYRSDAAVRTVAAQLSAQAVSLANTDPRRAALFALASDKLNHSDNSTKAMFTVAQNNTFVVRAARTSTGSNVSQIAVSGSTLLASDGDHHLLAMGSNDLKPIGRLAFDAQFPSPAGQANGDQFAVLDGSNLKLYQGAPSRLPKLVKTIKTIVGPDEWAAGPFYDSAGGVLVLSESLKGTYWSPKTGKQFDFDLRQDAWLSQHSGSLANLRVASGFSPGLYDDATSASDAATTQDFVISTTLNQTLRLHLYPSNPYDGYRDKPVPVWLESMNYPDTSVVRALGWRAKSLLVGTDAGSREWDVENSQTLAFPFGGLSEPVDAISSTGVEQGSVAVATQSGLSFLADAGAPLRTNNVDVPSAALDVVSSISAPYSSAATGWGTTWAVGRSDGRVVLVSPENRPMGRNGFLPTNSLFAVSDGTFVTVSGQTQHSSSMARYRPPWDPRIKKDGTVQTEPVMETAFDLSKVFSGGPFINDVAATPTSAAAAGRSPDGRPVIVAYDDVAKDNAHVLELGAESAPVENYKDLPEMVTAVEFDTAHSVLVGFNPRHGEIGFWSTKSWSSLGVLKLTAEGTDRLNSVMTASGDGSVLAVTYGNRVYVIDTAQRRVTKKIDAHQGRAWISADGKKIALSQPGGLRLMSVEGDLISDVNLGIEVQQMAWSPDGKTIATTSTLGDISIVDTSSGSLLGLPWRSVSGYRPLSFTWSPDGVYLYVNTGFSTGSFYEPKGVDIIEPRNASWVSQLCALAQPALTDKEWRDAGGGGITQPVTCQS